MDSFNSVMESFNADLIGIADLEGLETGYPSHFNRGISIALALNPKVINTIQDGPTLAYYEEYSQINERLEVIAQKTVCYIESLGYEALFSSATRKQDDQTLSTQLPHKTVARKAGLGWIGKSALLVTESFGPCVRLITVLTNMPLSANEHVVQSKCGTCTACVESCEGHAIKGINWLPTLKREAYYDAALCQTQAKIKCKPLNIQATICGMCIYACPYTKIYEKNDIRMDISHLFSMSFDPLMVGVNGRLK